MRIKGSWALLAMAPLVYGDAYNSLLFRYESQIKQQQHHLEGLRKNLQQKEAEAKRWQVKAEAAKSQWTDAGIAVERARKMVRTNQEHRSATRARADAVQWSVVEHASLSTAADGQIAYMTSELYKTYRTPSLFNDIQLASYAPRAVIDQLATLSQASHSLTEKAEAQEATLRVEEMRWQNEERKQSLALDRYRHQQQTLWLHWQQAIQRRQSLEEERVQLEQSAQALRVMLGELREHRDEVLASRPDTPRARAALNGLKGTLPWPVAGTVTQNFGKQYSEKLQQLVISNGIKVETEMGKPVRAIQAGKVLFARPFQQYGQLVIIQHHHGLTSVYGELGQTQVKEGDLVATLDAVGAVGDNRSFYFELRRNEEPINPLVWLTPNTHSELSSRRKFQ